MVSIVEEFKKKISFFDGLRNERLIEDYALIGGLALSAWVRPRTTRDVDLVVSLSRKITWPELVSLLETRLHKKVAVQKGTQRTNIEEKLSFVSGRIEVDVISTKGLDLAAHAIKSAVIAKVFGNDVKVATPEYLILLKLLPLSEQDAIDIKALVKKADKNKLISLAQNYFLLPRLESVISRRKNQ